MAKAAPIRYEPLPVPMPPKRGLFELVNNDAQLIEEEADKLSSQGIAWEDAIAQAVEAVDRLTSDKALSYAGFIRDLNAQADAIDAVAARSIARAKSKRGLAERLKARLLQLLPDDFKAENEHVSLSFVKRGFKVDDSMVENVAALPEDVLRTVPAVAEKKMLDKDKAEEKLKLIFSEVANLPEPEAAAVVKDRTKDLQGLKLVQIISVSIK